MLTFYEYKEKRDNKLKDLDSLVQDPGEIPDESTWKKWKSFINMTPNELDNFIDNHSEHVDDVSVVKNMLKNYKTYDDAHKNWTPVEWKAAKKHVSSITKAKNSRSKINGNPFEKNAKLTPWLKSMLKYGHDPRKN